MTDQNPAPQAPASSKPGAFLPAAAGILAGVAAAFGLDMSAEESAGIAAGVMAFVAVVRRALNKRKPPPPPAAPTAPTAALLLLLAGCSPTCPLADLDARYAADVVMWCTGADGRPLPLAECPAHPRIAAAYERDVAARIEAGRKGEPCPVP